MFWIAYILTRPLGDLLSQSIKHGGLGIWTNPVNIAFMACIIAAVA